MKGLQTAMWRGCQRHLQQSFTCETSVSRLSYLATTSNYKGMSVCKLARAVWRSINVCGKHTFTSVFMGAIKALQRCETCHPADLQQKTLRISHSYLSASSCPASDFPLRGSALSLIVYAKEPKMGKTLSDQWHDRLNMHIKAVQKGRQHNIYNIKTFIQYWKVLIQLIILANIHIFMLIIVATY